MMRFMWALFLVTFLMVDLASAQSIGPNQNDEDDVAHVESRMLPAPLPLEVNGPTQRAQPFDRIMYVLDVSGSMCGELASAIRVTGTFGSDDSRVAVVTFNDTHARWGGVQAPHHHLKTEPHGTSCLDPGWAFMPLHNQELMSHLSSFSGSGLTNPTSALDYAYKNVPDGTLIVFISDGGFSHRDGEDGTMGPLSAIRAGQAWRRAQKLAPIQTLVWATSEVDSRCESLVELAKLGGGGLWRADTRRSGPW